MSRRRKKPPTLELSEVLGRRVTVKINGVDTLMQPFEAQFEQCAHAALQSDIRACTRFINWCLRERLIAPIEVFDDHVDRVVIPKDWDDEEFLKMYDRLGPPPWAGLRDGLTADDREERRLAKRKGGRR